MELNQPCSAAGTTVGWMKRKCPFLFSPVPAKPPSLPCLLYQASCLLPSYPLMGSCALGWGQLDPLTWLIFPASLSSPGLQLPRVQAEPFKQLPLLGRILSDEPELGLQTREGAAWSWGGGKGRRLVDRLKVFAVLPAFQSPSSLGRAFRLYTCSRHKSTIAGQGDNQHCYPG